MARGPFADKKPVYALAFPGFTIGAHLRRLSKEESAVKGLNADDMNLEAHFADPMEGHPDLQHDMRATISPDFDGLSGTFTYKAKPNSRLTQVVSKIGVKVEGVFTESASSVDDGGDWETVERRRKVEVDSGSAAAPPEVQWVPEPVQVKFVSHTGSNFDDYGRERLVVIARRGTLQEGDILASAERKVNPEVWEVIPDGEYERAELRA